MKAFLIDGLQMKNHREIIKMVDIANQLNSPTFDIINSFNNTHVCKTLETLETEEKRKSYVLFCFFYLSKTYKDSVGRTINGHDLRLIMMGIIYPAFQELVKDGTFTSMPEWITTLFDQNKPDRFIKFRSSVMRTNFNNSQDLYDEFHKDMYKKSREISRKLSSESLYKYIVENPNITEIYGLIGATHLDILEVLQGHGDIISLSDYSKFTTLKIDDRTVQIELHGGTYGYQEHYDSLLRSLKNKGMAFEEPPSDFHEMLILISKFGIFRTKQSEPNSSYNSTNTPGLDKK